MKIQPIEITDKTGRQITIREGRIENSESLIKCVKSYLKSNQIPLTQDEFDEMAKGHKDWIKKFMDGRNDLLLVAEYDGQIIGNRITSYNVCYTKLLRSVFL